MCDGKIILVVSFALAILGMVILKTVADSV